MIDVSNDILFRVGGILHEARMLECYGDMQISSRRKWPQTIKEFRGQRHAGQPWIDVAVAQVRALVASGLLATSEPPKAQVDAPADEATSLLR